MALKVSELIERLQQFPAEMKVHVLDCSNDDDDGTPCIDIDDVGIEEAASGEKVLTIQINCGR